MRADGEETSGGISFRDEAKYGHSQSGFQSHVSDIDRLLRRVIISSPVGQHVNTC